MCGGDIRLAMLCCRILRQVLIPAARAMCMHAASGRQALTRGTVVGAAAASTCDTAACGRGSAWWAQACDWRWDPPWGGRRTGCNTSGPCVVPARALTLAGRNGASAPPASSQPLPSPAHALLRGTATPRHAAPHAASCTGEWLDAADLLVCMWDSIFAAATHNRHACNRLSPGRGVRWLGSAWARGQSTVDLPHSAIRRPRGCGARMVVW